MFGFFGFGSLFEAGLLIINAIAILNEERFLNKIGWGRNQWKQQPQFQGFGQMPEPGPKERVLTIIHSVRTVTRFPLIFVNIAVILYKVILG